MFDLNNISVWDWVLLGVLVALFLYQLYFYVRYMAGVQRRVRHQAKGRFRWKKPIAKPDSPDSLETQETPEAVKGVSVVVCAKNEAHNLQDFLQALLSQRYPLFEVIVVNDASEDGTELVLEHYLQRYKSLHLTFVPHNAWVRSSKKLGLTLAAKSAKYDYLLLTDADCVPESPNWISEMMRGFDNPQTDVVIGYGGYFDEDTLVCRRVQYDTIFSSLQFLGMAMSRHPYMGVGRNLAYKKSLFFETGGFAGLLNMPSGDDDLFVNKVATRQNTEVVVTRDSFTWSVPKRTFKEWRMQKYRHLSVAPFYKTSTKLRLGLEPFTRGLWYAGVIVAVVLACLGLIHPLIAAAAGLLFVARLIWQIAILNRATQIFGVRKMGLRVLWFDIVLPLNHLRMLLRHQFHRKEEMKW